MKLDERVLHTDFQRVLEKNEELDTAREVESNKPE